MRLLADENFPRPIVEWLRVDAHDVLWATTDCSGWRDPEILDLAESQGRIVLTLDKDFWQIAVQRRTPLKQGGIVLFRTQPATPDRLQPLIRMFVDAGKPWAGHISIVTSSGIQMLPTHRQQIPSGFSI